MHFFKAFATIIDKALERLSSYIDNNYINKASKKMMTWWRKQKKKYQEQNFVISDKNSDNEDKALTDGAKTNFICN